MIGGHLTTLLWLKSVLLRHTWTRGRTASLVITIIVAFLLVCVAFAVSAGLFVGGYFIGVELQKPDAEAEMALVLLLVCDAALFFFLLLWFSGVLTELQRSDIVDFRKMLHLPVSLRMVFLLNFGMSLFTPALLGLMLPVTGLALGLGVGLGPRMVLGIPMGLAFFFMLAAWTYYVRGMLAFLMENKRRRRALLVALPLVMVLLFQVPNLLLHTRIGRDREAKEVVEEEGRPDAAQRELEEQRNRAEREFETRRVMHYAEVGNAVLPVGWLPLGFVALSDARAWQAAQCFAGMTALGCLGLALGYRSTVRFYKGATRGTKPPIRVRHETAARDTRKRRLIDWTLPFVGDDTSAAALASFLAYVRHPMVRLQLIMPVVVGAVFLGINAGRMDANASQWVSIFVPVGVTVLPCLSCLAFFSNIFGIDHEGFGAFVLLPTPRHRYVLGKNLALFPITCGLALVFIAMSAFFIDYRPAVLGAAILQVLQLNLMFCLVGNVLSMYFPFRIRTAGRWGAGNMSTRTQLLMIVVSPMVLMMVAILTVPTVLGLTVDALLDRFYGFQGISVGFLVSAFTLLLTVLAYWGSLGPMGRLLLQREQTILAKLQKDRE